MGEEQKRRGGLSGRPALSGTGTLAKPQISFSVPFMMPQWPGNEQKNV